jgi:DNA invertase Pin-like site-specific DNA recombinase
MKNQKPNQKIERNVALCYVRLSVTKDASDLTSPERQRANIQAACEKHGWTPEWYEDAKGHKSATKEENRPAWLALKERLKDPDVFAVVVNEQSRAMRNAWRAIKLFEELPGYGIVLHLATLDRTIDITTPDGRMTAYFQAFMDDLYALDASRRVKDSVKFRKGKGIGIGIPPFGTIRDDNGHLIPSPFGAWLMPDGSFQLGKMGNPPPHPEALWRGYYECAEHILEVYRENKQGYQNIATQLNYEKWAFRDRWGNPRSILLDDVRRVTSLWREYAGLISTGKARDRIASKIENPTSVLQDTGHAVFDLELLYAVAKTQEDRSVLVQPTGTVRSAHIFALSHLLYCAHCDEKARREANPNTRARIIGWQKLGSLRYRHSERRLCNCQTNSVFASIIEDDFVRLVNVLSVHPNVAEIMADIAVQSQAGKHSADDTNVEEQKKVAVAKHRRALKNNLTLFQSGEIDDIEYYRQKDFHERQIGRWEAQIADRQKVLFEITTTIESLRRIQDFWDMSQGEDRKLLAHSMFDEIVYDLDRRRIVDFKVKQWAEPYVIMRSTLYRDQMGEEMKNRFNSGLSSKVSYYSPNGSPYLS